MPLLGGLWEGRNPAFAEMRTWPIRRFKNYIIYYRPIPTGIEVIRVLHGAQDVERIFEETE
jgi:toxin ParE1/3/4